MKIYVQQDSTGQHVFLLFKSFRSFKLIFLDTSFLHLQNSHKTHLEASITARFEYHKKEPFPGVCNLALQDKRQQNDPLLWSGI